MRNPRETLKAALIQERFFCEAKAFSPHSCQGGLELHEAIYTRDDARASVKAKTYIIDRLNCAILCSYAHQKWGRSAAWRSWFVGKQIGAFGRLAMENYVSGAPIRIRRTLEELLAPSSNAKQD